MAATEVLVTDPKTGGKKGMKDSQLGAIHPRALLELGRVAGFGSTKYGRYNFLKGYAWSLSYDALQRHAHQFWGGEDIDEEGGFYHLGAVAWHALTLLTFKLLGLGTDDRPPSGHPTE